MIEILGLSSWDQLRCLDGGEDYPNDDSLHLWFVSLSVPVDVVEDNIERNILDEVPSKSSDAESYVPEVI